MEARAWIGTDESAGEMLARVLAERPSILLPPLHRVPLRPGNVVEIAGPSPSAKSEILLQAAINCILPKQWNGVHLGGLERLVMYFDLDCRFDILRLALCLKLRLMEAHGFTCYSHGKSNFGLQKEDGTVSQAAYLDDELFLACMRRFLYIRCYSSYEFLATLKTMRYRIQKESEALGVGVHFLMIDSVGAFYWTDRASQPLSPEGSHRKNLSLRCIVETVVQEIHRLLQNQPVLILATKATVLGIETSMNEASRMLGRWCPEEPSDLRISDREKYLYREYMPSAWQSFVTHRIILRVSDKSFADREHGNSLIYSSEWVLPPLNIVDRFAVRDAGIFMIS